MKGKNPDGSDIHNLLSLDEPVLIVADSRIKQGHYRTAENEQSCCARCTDKHGKLDAVLLAALTMRFSLRVTAWEIAGTRLIESESVSTAAC